MTVDQLELFELSLPRTRRLVACPKCNVLVKEVEGWQEEIAIHLLTAHKDFTTGLKPQHFLTVPLDVPLTGYVVIEPRQPCRYIPAQESVYRARRAYMGIKREEDETLRDDLDCDI